MSGPEVHEFVDAEGRNLCDVCEKWRGNKYHAARAAAPPEFRPRNPMSADYLSDRHRNCNHPDCRAAAPPVGPTVSERYQPGMTWDDKRGGFVEIVPPSPEPDAWTDADDDAVLAATAEACRDAVTDSTQRLVVAFRRFVLERFGTAMTEDDFRSILRDAARLANRDSDAAGTYVGHDGREYEHGD